MTRKLCLKASSVLQMVLPQIHVSGKMDVGITGYDSNYSLDISPLQGIRAFFGIFIKIVLLLLWH